MSCCEGLGQTGDSKGIVDGDYSEYQGEGGTDTGCLGGPLDK